MATIDVKDAAGLPVAIEKPLVPGRAAAASSRPVVISTEDLAALTNVQFAEDGVHASGDKGTFALVVRKDTATQLAGTDGDYSGLINDASGRLWVNVGALPALIAGSAIIGKVGIDQTTPGTTDRVTANLQLAGTALTAGAGAVAAGTPRYTHASDDPLVTAAGAIGDSAWSSGNGSHTALLKTIATAALDTTTPVPVTGFLATIAVTPTVVATPDYTTGMTMGGIMTFASILRASTKTAYAVSVRAILKIANTAQIDFLIFNASPAASTTTDNAAFLLSATDAPKLKGIVSLTSTDWYSGGSGFAVGYKEARIPITGAAASDLYVVAVARGTFNLGSTSDLIVELSVDQN